jgi:F-type H+-transporting ATPase subunit a
VVSSEARASGSRRKLLVLIGAVLVLNVLAVIFVPPFPRGGQPGDACAFPVCYIDGNLEFPAPHVVLDLAPGDTAGANALLTFHPSISSSLLTLWVVSALLLVLAVVVARRRAAIPGRVQNAVEFIYESLGNFATSLGGPGARKYVPIFAAFFLLILFSNWSGLIPFVGKVEFLRAPTSDVNTTIGLALVSFALFHIEGIRALGVKSYLGKFFPLREFRAGVSAGLIAMFVGLVELMLEFVKPLTLSMRLFGNIYGGEVALGVMTSLTLAALVPVALLGLEFMLNFIQALIFSVLTLMFILAAIEGHAGEHEAAGHAPAGARHEPVPVAG